MSKQLAVIGVAPHELRWVKILIFLLRNPDPGLPELTREALLYLQHSIEDRDPSALPAAAAGEKNGP